MIKRATKLDIKKEGKEKTREATKKRERERARNTYTSLSVVVTP